MHGGVAAFIVTDKGRGINSARSDVTCGPSLWTTTIAASKTGATQILRPGKRVCARDGAEQRRHNDNRDCGKSNLSSAFPRNFRPLVRPCLSAQTRAILADVLPPRPRRIEKRGRNREGEKRNRKRKRRKSASEAYKSRFLRSRYVSRSPFLSSLSLSL